MTTHPNLALRQRMQEMGLKQVDLAMLMRRIAPTLRVTDRYVRMLLTGYIRWPQPATRDALEKALDRSIQDLGFVPRTPRRQR